MKILAGLVAATLLAAPAFAQDSGKPPAPADSTAPADESTPPPADANAASKPADTPNK